VISKKGQERRLWKLRVAKAFSNQEQLPLGEIRRALGGTVLDGVLDECYAIHSSSPEDGARMARTILQERHSNCLLMPSKRRKK
jgi:hypothetical protein